jgi:hypothetical protein
MQDDEDVRHSMVRGSIVIPDNWADRWDRVMAFRVEPESRLALVLEAVLKAIIVHQLTHWLSHFAGSYTLLEGCRLPILAGTTPQNW